MATLPLGRRGFLALGLSFAPSFAFARRLALREGLLDLTGGEAPKRHCVPTEPLEMGPYYREGALQATDLCGAGETGRRIVVRGQVFGADTCAPLREALIEVWQADAEGHYDFQDKPEPASPRAFRMRGALFAGRDGSYGFRSLVPGNYAGGDGSMRAKHIHFMVRRSGYEPLITQLYFEGDAWNAKDPLVRASLIRPVRGGAEADGRMDFDIVLRRERPVGRATLATFGDFIGTYADPSKPAFRVAIAWKDGGLLATVEGEGDSSPLRYEGPGHFFAPIWAAKVTFLRDPDGRVRGLIGELDNGIRSELKRVE